jgi:hypothetical protein
MMFQTSRVARNFLIVVILAVAIDLFTSLPTRAAQRALDSGTWDLAVHLTGGVPSPDVASPVLPLLIGAIVLAAALSSSSSRDRW